MNAFLDKLVSFETLGGRLLMAELPVLRGRVTGVSELVITAELAGARVSQQCLIRPSGRSTLLAEVAACDGLTARLLPLGELRGLGPGDPVEVIASQPVVPCGPSLLGRVVDPTGQPLIGPPLSAAHEFVPLSPGGATALDRGRIRAQFVTGVASIDGCCALGEGQRIGLMAGPGVGKSTLLGRLAVGADAEVCITCLVGERAREAAEAAEVLAQAGRAERHVLVVATAEAPVLLRLRAVAAATAMARWFAAAGHKVLLLVDSLTRVARAGREAFSSLGEAAAHGGYPASALAMIPKLVEGAAVTGPGSLTAVYAVLTENGSVDPVAQEAKAVLDGHLVLSSRLAQAGLFPAVDIVESVSRVAQQVCPALQVEAARKLRRAMHRLRQNEDLVLMGAYQKGACRDTDFALENRTRIEALLYPQGRAPMSQDELRQELEQLTAGL